MSHGAKERGYPHRKPTTALEIYSRLGVVTHGESVNIFAVLYTHSVFGGSLFSGSRTRTLDKLDKPIICVCGFVRVYRITFRDVNEQRAHLASTVGCTIARASCRASTTHKNAIP